MKETIDEIIKICDRHADRLNWAMTQLQKHTPFTGQTLKQINDVELAILDQFSTRFGKLQDLMGAKLFPTVLEITKEPGELKVFIDKLYRLEKIGAIASADDWLLKIFYPYGLPLIVPSELRHSVLTGLLKPVGAEDFLPDVMQRIGNLISESL